jgi:hypothetical protein
MILHNEDSLEYLAECKLKNFLYKIRKETPKKEINCKKIGYFDDLSGNLEGNPVRRYLVELNSVGCEWALKGGGCSMCGHIAGTTQGKHIISEDIISQFREWFNKKDFSDHPLLCLYNMGSFLNDNEMPQKARVEILKLISNNKDIKKVILESRPEYITEEHLEELKNYLPSKIIEIGIGFESGNKFIRDVIINKGYTLEDFEKAIKLIKKYKLRSLVYLQVKPPFLTEREAIDDAINTAKFCFGIGVDVISFEPTSLQKYTLPTWMFENNKYRVPWLWSVLEIANQTCTLGEIRLGGYEYLPKPDVTAFNCNKCSIKLKKLIDKFNGNYDINLFKDFSCDCKDKWIEELKKEDYRSFAKRILEDLSNS